MAMRELSRREVVARWLWGAEYAASGLSAIDWNARLSPSRRSLVTDFILEYEDARKAEQSSEMASNG